MTGDIDFAAIAREVQAMRVHECPRCGSRGPHPGPCETCRAAREVIVRCRQAWLRTCPPRYRDALCGTEALAERVHDGQAVQVARDALRTHTVLVLLGPSGVGKTTLACATAAAWVDSTRRPAAYVSALALATARAESPLGRRPEVIDTATTAGLIVLDDLGNDALTPQSAVVEVVFARHDAERPMVVTSGLTRRALADRYGAGCARRLLEGARVVEMAARRQ